MYNVNEYLIYGKDVCKVCEIEEKKFNNEDYYLLRPVKDPTLKIEVPVSNKVGKIRNLISKNEVEEIINQIPSITTITTDEKYIENEYKNLLATGNHEDLIKIIKTSYLRNKQRLENNKKLADKDSTYYNLAEEYLYNEFSIVLGYDFEQTKDYVMNKVSNLSENNT